MNDQEPRADEWAANVARFTGFAAVYDEARPRPPAVLSDLLPQLAGAARPGLVVDLGCGTGLSTRYWADRADQVVGLDPSADMLVQARQSTAADNVSYRLGFPHDTGLTAGAADLVTCSQALHWMEPQGTFREAARVLRAGGVFAAYDCDWPPLTPCWEVDAAFEELRERCARLERETAAAASVRRWSKSGHLERMRASGRFRCTRELAVHSVETGDAARLIGLLLSQGQTATLLKRGFTEAEVGLTAFRRSVEATMGAVPCPWWFTYRVSLGLV